ncbi:uncharacterized protein LOC113312468 [Papaver somniferum]|uniref:uncharacterized protein LOC113312468 n=1 Tax=Papaver somniferum TaxID=3469 RepID=UPI000E703553|nr:uncharacterized protein LOC113312468 [Papaver somniferum]
MVDPLETRVNKIYSDIETINGRLAKLDMLPALLSGLMDFLHIQPNQDAESSTKPFGFVYTKDIPDKSFVNSHKNKEKETAIPEPKNKILLYNIAVMMMMMMTMILRRKKNIRGGLKNDSLELVQTLMFMDVPEKSKVKLVAYKLKGGAVAWWEKIREDRIKYSKPLVRTWTRMHKLIRDKFLPQDYKQQLFVKLQNCHQGTRPVEDYVAEFYNLIARNEIQETEEQLVACFIEGLHRLIQNNMTQSVFTMVEAIQQAIKIEKLLLRTSRLPPPRQNRYSSNYKPQQFSVNFSYSQTPLPANSSPILQHPVEISPVQQTLPKSTPIRFSNRHLQQFPPLSKLTNIYSKFRGEKCNRCQPTEHTSADCCKFNGFIGDAKHNDDSQDNEDWDNELDTGEPTEIHDAYGEHLVGIIRPLLLNQPCLSQRHSIFRAKCIIGGKVCDMIIDSGSVENYVVAHVVEKLGLSVTPHPHLYSVGWVNGSSTQRISHQCVVDFSFPGYEDSVLCDVIDMSSSHLLLGRPCRSEKEHLLHLSKVFKVLQDNTLFVSLKKCTFLSSEVTFLGYVVSDKGIHVDPSKIKAIQDYLIPTSIKDIRSFHGLASFYRRFIRNFSTIAAPITECLKQDRFVWTEEADKMLSQEGHPAAFHSKKNTDTQKKWSTYELELLALVQALKQWHTYLVRRDFVVNTDNHALKFLQTSAMINRMHDRCLSIINKYIFSVRHKSGKTNQVADALSRRVHLLASIRNESFSFDYIKYIYAEDEDFKSIWEKCGSTTNSVDDFLQEGFLFKGNRLCIPQGSLRLHLIRELHGSAWWTLWP